MRCAWTFAYADGAAVIEVGMQVKETAVNIGVFVAYIHTNIIIEAVLFQTDVNNQTGKE